MHGVCMMSLAMCVNGVMTGMVLTLKGLFWPIRDREMAVSVWCEVEAGTITVKDGVWPTEHLIHQEMLAIVLGFASLFRSSSHHLVRLLMLVPVWLLLEEMVLLFERQWVSELKVRHSVFVHITGGKLCHHGMTCA